MTSDPRAILRTALEQQIAVWVAREVHAPTVEEAQAAREVITSLNRIQETALDTLDIAVTRAILRYTVKGYKAGENAESKHWRERAEKAEAASLCRAQRLAQDAFSLLAEERTSGMTSNLTARLRELLKGGRRHWIASRNGTECVRADIVDAALELLAASPLCADVKHGDTVDHSCTKMVGHAGAHTDGAASWAASATDLPTLIARLESLENGYRHDGWLGHADLLRDAHTALLELQQKIKEEQASRGPSRASRSRPRRSGESRDAMKPSSRR